MALVRITHADGTVETIRTSGAIEEINVQQSNGGGSLAETPPASVANGNLDTTSDDELDDGLIDIVQVTNGTDFLDGDTVGDGVTPIGMVGIAGDYGTLFMFSNGFYEYDLNKKNPKVQALTDGEQLSDVFSYAITHSDGGSDTDTLTMDIRGTKKGPKVCNDDDAVDAAMISAATEAGGDKAITVRGPRAKGEGLTVIGHTGGDKYGTLTLNADGSYGYELDHDNGDVIALGEGETLTEVYTYAVTDGVDTDTARLTITITGASNGPATVNTSH